MSVPLIEPHEQTFGWHVATEVRALVARHMIPQAKIAEALGVGPMHVSRRLSGKTPFDVDELAAVARLLGVEVVELLPRPHTYVDPVKVVRRRADGKWGRRNNGGEEPTRTKVSAKLRAIRGEGLDTAPRRGHLRAVSPR
jgi:transcriptional regulator with XRE-family HTH domain